MNDKNLFYLHQALDLAKIRRGFCAPNPSVGCVIVRDNEVLATGYHFEAGDPHAEVDALKKIDFSAQGATVYVTLEPCCHQGRTPPCTDSLIKANVKRVVYAYRDPNPVVTGKSEALLKQAGIECEYISVPEIEEFYKSYHHWHQTKRPFVTAKLAVTLDGKIAGVNGEPIKITGADINEFTHQCRKNTDAILTTAKTIIQDNPKLNARIHNSLIPKALYILDTHLSMPLTVQVFETSKSITIFHGPVVTKERQMALSALGARLLAVDLVEEQLNLCKIIDQIGEDGMHDLWVEAGSRCFNSFVANRLANRALIYIAPWVLGDGVLGFSWNMDFRAARVNWQKFDQDVLCEIHW